MTPRQYGPIPNTRLGLAAALWCYGEDELWPAALSLPPNTVADICRLAGQMSTIETEKRYGRKITKSSALALATIATLTGTTRCPKREFARDRKHLPIRLRQAYREQAIDRELAQIRKLLDA